MRVPANQPYVPSRCQALFVCQYLDAVFVTAPNSWTFERIATGDYRVYPNPADVPDVRRAIVLQDLYGIAPAEKATPVARTFLVSFDVNAAAFVVKVMDLQQVATDTDFSFLVVVPG